MIEVSVTDKAGTIQSYSTARGERVLHSGLAAGCTLPYECGTGTCGSCRATLQAGEVERLWTEAPGAKGFRKDGEVLMCQIAAKTNLSLKIRGQFSEDISIVPQHLGGYVSPAKKLTPEVAWLQITLDAPINFVSGQFVLVEIPGIEGPRAYSMTTAGGWTDRLELLVRLAPQGEASQWLFDGKKERPVRVFGPLGKATYSPDDKAPFVAIAGGSGIAGILSILNCAIEGCLLKAAPAQLYFGLREPKTAYLLDEIASAVTRAKGSLAATIVFSEGFADDALRAQFPKLEFKTGLVPDVATEKVSELTENTRFYVGGPPRMVDATMRALILAHHIPISRIRYDKFG